MARLFFEDENASQRWRYYLHLSRFHPYTTLQKQIIKVYEPYQSLISKYSSECERNIHPLETQYLEEHPEVSLQNIALLKNSMQLWKDASNTSEAIAPVLHHYCFHCFISFFIYTFFRWEPEHTKSHGVRLSKWSENIPEIEIQFIEKGGLFQRFVDTWTLLGASLAFSPVMPIFEEDEIIFIKNNDYILKDKKYLTLKELTEFKPREFEKKVLKKFGDKLIKCHFIGGSAIMQVNNNLKNYLILYLASNIARYRPYLWEIILDGKTFEYSNFARDSTTALYDLSINNLLGNVQDLFWSIENQYFSITH